MNNKLIFGIVGGVVGLGLIVALAISVATDPGVSDDIGFGEVEVDGSVLPQFTDPANDPSVGTPAPTISGADWEGNAVSIQPDGRAKMIVFLAHWCPHCQNEVPVVQSWINGGGLPEGVDLYGVASLTNRVQPNWPPQDWLEDEGWTAPVIMDDAVSTAAVSMGLSGTPFWVVLDGDNNVLARVSGEVGLGGIQTLANIASSSV